MIDAEEGDEDVMTQDCATGGIPTSRGYTTHRGRTQRHGLHTLRASVRALGPRVLDRRTTLGKQLAAWKAELVADLGGNPSTGQRQLVELAVRTKLLLDSIDAWLLAQPSLVNHRKRSVYPAVRERQALADSLARYLGQLGLERRAQPVVDLASYVATKSSGGSMP